MLASLREAASLYKKHILKILLLGITILLPIQMVYTIVVNMLSLPFQYFGIPLWSDFFQSMFMLMSVFFIFIPFISLVVQHTREGTVKIRKLYRDTFLYGFFIYMLSIPIAILTSIGFFLFIIPGLVLLVLSLGIPFVKIIENESLKVTIKKSFLFGKDNFLRICGLLLLFAIMDFIGSYLFSFIAIITTGQLAVTNWLLMIWNMFLLPLFIFAITKQYLDWNGEVSLEQYEDYEYQLNQYR